jgi:5-methylcytosine-specific restriction endonuclease McrA
MDGPSAVLDVGRTTRTIPSALRRAVVARDRTCASPGCYRPPEHCDVHHVVFWADGGDTSLDNLVLACRRHHRLIHQQGWQVTVDASGRRSIGPP